MMKLTVKLDGVYWEDDLRLLVQSGGRGFDETICKYFFKDFEERYLLSLSGNQLNL